jgi:caspase domain-containing protein
VSNGTRTAFVVANDAYADPRLRRLRAPAADAEELARVLGDAEIGSFDVQVSTNEPEHVVRRKLSAFFENRGLDDLLVLHLSCHGLKDEDGRLYFATADTELDHLEATAIPSEFVNRQMTRSRSRRIVLLLDCCYSGAFATGLMSRAGDRVDIKERFDGRGRVVLTASSAMEYSFEGDELAGEGRPSVFTSALVRGLATGEADRNRDGWISVDELYDFAYDEVRAVTPSQTPGKWVFDVQGDLYVARSGLAPEPQEISLPADLIAATKSPFANIRAGAVEELAGLLGGPDESLTTAAREALEQLERDDSRRVALASAAALGGSAAESDPLQRAPEPVQRAPEPRSAPVPEPPAPAHVPRLLRAGAPALLAALPTPVLASSYEGWNLFAVLSPFEAIGAALASWYVSYTLSRSRMSTSFAAGILVAVGALTFVASCALLKFTIERVDPVAIVLSVVVLLGSIVILVAGVSCMQASSGVADVVPVDPGALLLGLAGVSLAFAALFVNYDGGSTLWSEVGERTSAEFFFEPATVVIAMLVGLLALGSRPKFAAGLLLAIGGATALHYLGVVFAAWRAVGEVGNVRAAGFIGLLGGLLVAADAAYVSGSANRDRDKTAITGRG